MICLGVDPSTSGCAYAMLDVTGGDRRFLACGELEDIAALDEVVFRHRPELLAVECPLGLNVHPRPFASADELQKAIMMLRSMGAALMRASRVVGYVSCLARQRGVPCLELAPAKWRGIIGANGKEQDAAVKEAIQMLIAGWPKRSNCHVRDAAGTALAAAWTMAKERRTGT